VVLAEVEACRAASPHAAFPTGRAREKMMGQARILTEGTKGDAKPGTRVTAPSTNHIRGVFVTNTLEQAIQKSELLLGKFIFEEANAATDIKRNLPILVVIH